MTFESPIVVLANDNVDTDQVIPARFLKTLTQEGLAIGCSTTGGTTRKGVPGRTSF